MALPADLPIQPFRAPARGVPFIPGSKSITNRALILAAQCPHPVTLKDALFSRDTRIMMTALKALGFSVEADEAARMIQLSGAAEIPAAEAEIHVGNAGTAARFLTAFLATRKGGRYRVDGDEAMYERPMQGLLDALEKLGAAKVTYERTHGHIPFVMDTQGLPGGTATVDAAASSQLLSALLLVGGKATEALTVCLAGRTVSRPFVEMTSRMLAQFGVDLEAGENADTFRFSAAEGPRLKTPSYTVEPDATAASYFFTLPLAVGGKLRLEMPPIELQGDIDFIEPLGQAGGRVTELLDGYLTAGAGRVRAFDYDFEAISDTFLTLAALTPLADGPCTIRGIAHTRKQETDRVSAMAQELQRLGQRVEEAEDSLTIYPSLQALREKAREGRECGELLTIQTYEDHRFAMSFGILGSADLLGDGQPWLQIHDPACCGKTFPQFFEVLEHLRAVSESSFVTVAVDGGAATGKSSTSRGVAQACGFLHVDTGSHYRALTVGCLDAGIEADNAEQMAEFLPNLELASVVEEGSAQICVNGRRFAAENLRSEAVNAVVSDFAAVGELRAAIRRYQRDQAEVARSGGFAGVVIEGRDIGSVIFPDADVKIFLEADAETRAERRAAEGQSDAVAERDRRDASRKSAPLTCPEGARVINTGAYSLEEVIGQVCELIRSAR